MNKIQMAHEYALEMLKETLPTGSLYGDDANRVAMSMVESAWVLADAMQAEAEKRSKAEAEQKRKEVREILKDENTFIDREWQPDWSQAPEWAEYWHYDSYRSAYWVDAKPDTRSDTAWSFDFMNKRVVEAPSFGYQSNWKDSLRKRPEPKWKVDWSQAPNDAIGWMIFDGSSTWLGADGYLIENAPSFGFTGTHIVERPQ